MRERGREREREGEEGGICLFRFVFFLMCSFCFTLSFLLCLFGLLSCGAVRVRDRSRVGVPDFVCVRALHVWYDGFE